MSAKLCKESVGLLDGSAQFDAPGLKASYPRAEILLVFHDHRGGAVSADDV
jgi:hypothetical protein